MKFVVGPEGAGAPEQQARWRHAQRWRSRFQFVTEPPEDRAEFHLRLVEGTVRLCRGSDDAGVQLTERAVRQRLKGEFALGRACGQPRQGISVLDATAGFGLDGLALAGAGFQVTLLERQPALWCLLDDFLDRHPGIHVVLELIDARSYLVSADSPRHDVVYFDPMFPRRNKKALPGKAMQYLSELLSEDPPFEPELLELAITRAKSRVVLKRRARDPLIGRPDWQIKGRTVRYDVYRCGGG